MGAHSKKMQAEDHAGKNAGGIQGDIKLAGERAYHVSQHVSKRAAKQHICGGRVDHEQRPQQQRGLG